MLTKFMSAMSTNNLDTKIKGLVEMLFMEEFELLRRNESDIRECKETMAAVANYVLVLEYSEETGNLNTRNLCTEIERTINARESGPGGLPSGLEVRLKISPPSQWAGKGFPMGWEGPAITT